MDVTEETWERDVVERSAERPVVVDFWAEWCGPCHMLAPALEEAVGERDGEVVLAKVDVDANQGLAQRFGVMGIPAVKAFRDGRVVGEFVGVQSPASIRAFLEQVLGPTPGERLLEELRESGEFPEVLAALEEGDHETALVRLLAGIDGTGPEERARIRDVAVALFGELGQDHPVSQRYRRRLAAALY